MDNDPNIPIIPYVELIESIVFKKSTGLRTSFPENIVDLRTVLIGYSKIYEALTKPFI